VNLAAPLCFDLDQLSSALFSDGMPGRDESAKKENRKKIHDRRIRSRRVSVAKGKKDISRKFFTRFAKMFPSGVW
jgi:hypothetical protein